MATCFDTGFHQGRVWELVSNPAQWDAITEACNTAVDSPAEEYWEQVADPVNSMADTMSSKLTGELQKHHEMDGIEENGFRYADFSEFLLSRLIYEIYEECKMVHHIGGVESSEDMIGHYMRAVLYAFQHALAVNLGIEKLIHIDEGFKTAI